MQNQHISDAAQASKRRRKEDEVEIEDEDWDEEMDAALSSAFEDASTAVLPGHISLVYEVFEIVLACLSARELLLAGQVSKEWYSAAGTDLLWRTLFLQRWPEPSSVSERGGWRKLYVDGDRLEHAKILEETGEFREGFLQMHAAQRSLCLSDSKKEARSSVGASAVARAVASWRTRQTFRPDPSHNCSGLKCDFHVVGEVYVCKTTGNEHLCGAQCQQGHAGFCPVSGLQVAAWVGGVEEEEEVDEQPEDIGAGGFFTGVFASGYAADEDEHKRMIHTFGAHRTRRAIDQFNRLKTQLKAQCP